MSLVSLFPIFMIGLLGGVHCIGMCGGIVSAFSVASQPRPRFPVAVVSQAAPAVLDGALRVLSYNLGRIGSYMAAGAIAGGVVGAARTMESVAGLQVAGYWLANLMLVALGLYLMDAWRGLARLERAGSLLWRRIQPLTRFLLPIDSAGKALALGALWGWLPCGMVYSVLMTAMLTGSAASGAAVMLAFGLGTLPLLMTMGMAGDRLRAGLRKRAVRSVAGMVVLSFGLLGLARIAWGLSFGWLDILCLTPAVHP